MVITTVGGGELPKALRDFETVYNRDVQDIMPRGR